MNVFDQIDPGSLDRRMWQLWILALTTILVLGTGLALMMYAVVFARPVGLTERSFGTLFIGYCVLMPLIIGYLFDRQMVIKQLRRKITEEQYQLMNLQHEFRVNLLENLPGLAHFQDRLAMEFRRASTAEQPISLVAVGVKPSFGLGAEADEAAIFGDVAKALTRKLRGEDSLYYLDRGVFGILLPRVQTNIAGLVVNRLEEGLREAAGPELRFLFETQITNYPDHTASAREMSQAVAAFVSGRHAGPARNSLAEELTSAA